MLLSVGVDIRSLREHRFSVVRSGLVLNFAVKRLTGLFEQKVVVYEVSRVNNKQSPLTLVGLAERKEN